TLAENRAKRRVWIKTTHKTMSANEPEDGWTKRMSKRKLIVKWPSSNNTNIVFISGTLAENRAKRRVWIKTTHKTMSANEPEDGWTKRMSKRKLIVKWPSSNNTNIVFIS
ncbi:hypothetical protein ACJX0J_024556, partial [Zea mays]